MLRGTSRGAFTPSSPTSPARPTSPLRSTFSPDAGWIDFDPANDVIPSDNHVTVAYGCDFGDVTPVRGVLLGGWRHSLRV